MNNQVKLKKGDWVVMHTCIEATNPENYGKLWQCKTDQFTRGKGVYAQDSVFLEGYSGSFAPEFLQKVNLPDTPPVPTIKPEDKERAAFEQIKERIDEALNDGDEMGWKYALNDINNIVLGLEDEE